MDSATPPPCEKTAGVCAGAVRASLADGGFEPLCTSTSYGPDYESSETRCDGLDNDCDGETDRHWAVLHPRSPHGTWSVSAARLDGGFVVFAHERDGGFSLRRFDDQLAPIVGAAEEVQLPDAGRLAAESLVVTRQGMGLSYLMNQGSGNSTSGFYTPLSQEGTLERGADGEPLVSQVTAGLPPAWGMRTVPSLDGTRVLMAFHPWPTDASYPEEVVGVVTDEVGTVLAGPTSLMRIQTDGLRAGLFLSSLAGEGSGFLLVATEGIAGTQAQTLRLQRYSSTLEPVGDERRIEVSGDANPLLASASGSTTAALAYRELSVDGSHQLRVVRNLFDGGAPETWVESIQDVSWSGFQGTPGGLQLAWKEQTPCPDCPQSDGFQSFKGRVFARSESSGVIELTPGAADLQFDSWSRPGVHLTQGPEGWMTFFLPVLGDGGVDLRAVSYCKP